MIGQVSRTGSKHSGKSIFSEKRVGANLLASIREVLGAGASEQVIAAWGEAYNFLAEIFIARERQIYGQAEA